MKVNAKIDSRKVPYCKQSLMIRVHMLPLLLTPASPLCLYATGTAADFFLTAVHPAAFDQSQGQPSRFAHLLSKSLKIEMR